MINIKREQLKYKHNAINYYVMYLLNSLFNSYKQQLSWCEKYTVIKWTHVCTLCAYYTQRKSTKSLNTQAV